jgi:protein phosphatase
MQAPRPRGIAVEVDLAALSHPGRVRTNNEDHYLVFRAVRSLRTCMTNLPEVLLPCDFEETVHVMGVADGIGGRAAGEVASQLALALFVDLVLDTPDWIFSHDELRMVEVLKRAVQRFRSVNAALLERARRDPRLAGMGTTLTVAMSLGLLLTVAHLGDSRVYLLRRGELHRLTWDHTLAQELADLGRDPAEDAATHALRNVLSDAIGLREDGGKPEVRRLRLADGDRLLLCTDGLTEMVDDATIAAEMGRDRPAAEVCQGLLDLALDRGGLDNVTIVVAGYRIPEGQSEPRPCRDARQQSRGQPVPGRRGRPRHRTGDHARPERRQ